MNDRQKESDFLQLIHAHQGIIHKICFLYCHDHTDKQDLYQEIVMQLWKSFPSFKGGAAFSTWMYRVALNTAITSTKKLRSWLRAGSVQESHYETEKSFELSEDVKILYRAISHLNKTERGIILLWLEEKSYEEIAETFGITVKNVSVKLVRIKNKLAGIIKKIQLV